MALGTWPVLRASLAGPSFDASAGAELAATRSLRNDAGHDRGAGAVEQHERLTLRGDGHAGDIASDACCGDGVDHAVPPRLGVLGAVDGRRVVAGAGGEEPAGVGVADLDRRAVDVGPHPQDERHAGKLLPGSVGTGDRRTGRPPLEGVEQVPPSEGVVDHGHR